MSKNSSTTPKDFFLWLMALIALYFSVGSLVALYFEYIERLVGSAAVIGYDPYSGGIQFAIASLLVLFPVYIIVTRLLNSDIRKNPGKKDIWVRRWAIFLTLFAAAMGMIIDLVVLLTTFLGGEELTAAFLLKVATVFVLFGGVFLYYLKDIKGVWEKNEKKSKSIGAVVSVIILVSIVAGFFIMGSPYTQRMLRYDQQRVNDLQSLQAQVTDYYRQTEELPATLEDLKDPLVGGRYFGTDPDSGEDYEYTKTGDLSFELCATFSLPLPEFDETKADPTNYRVQEAKRIAADWPHDEGRTCFERDVNTDRVTPYSKEVIPTLVR